MKIEAVPRGGAVDLDTRGSDASERIDLRAEFDEARLPKKVIGARRVIDMTRVRAMRRAGFTWVAIGEEFGFSGDQMRQRALRIDPSLGSNRAPATKPQCYVPEVPDTRTFTQKFCGDPLPGRSALDRKRARGAWL